tara:strand:- start:366 stop:569 length:204 start_codon:yes stop_codon:yes gene_type:complete
MAEFQFIINRELVTFDKYEDIPDEFEHVIKFLPDVILEPHTEEEHEEMAQWNTRLQKLMEKERGRSN